ncbi:MAG: hypothetical protein J6B19_00735 [Lachnospiraceae bacterium]|nr:hypothetical protein [Lachnospiraceae bacterium]
MKHKTKRKIKKISKGFLIGVGLAAATLYTVIFVFVYLFLLGPPGKATRDVSRYEEIFTEQSIQTGYMTFPETIPEGAQVLDYYHYYRDTWNMPTVQTYLKCAYDDVTYRAEIDRLENTSKTYGGKKKELLRDEKKKFNFPVYIAVENAAHSYEYALLPGGNEIVYIYTSYIEKNKVEFDEAYLPYDFMTEEGREFGSGYSIYYGSVSSTGISTYFTRDPVPEVTDAHVRMAGDDMFFVHVRLNEEGKEIITSCSFHVYEKSGEESSSEEYHDIDGAQYKDMEVNRDRTEVTVTYIENGAEKTITYPLTE